MLIGNEHYTRKQCVTILVLGALQGLKEKGLVSGGEGCQLSPKGIAVYDQLKASGFAATPREIRAAMRAIQAECESDN